MYPPLLGPQQGGYMLEPITCTPLHMYSLHSFNKILCCKIFVSKICIFEYNLIYIEYINLMWIWTIRINLIFRVFLALYRPQFTGQYIMNPSKRKSRRSIEKSDEEQKSEHSSDQSDCSSYIVFSKQKRMKLMKGNMLQSDDVMVPNTRVRKFQIDPQKFEKFAAEEVFSDSDETEEESEEDDNDIDYDKVPITRKFKVITWENNSSNMF